MPNGMILFYHLMSPRITDLFRRPLEPQGAWMVCAAQCFHSPVQREYPQAAEKPFPSVILSPFAVILSEAKNHAPPLRVN